LRERLDVQKKRKKRFTWYFLFFLVIVAIYSFLNSAYFTVTTIEVAGNKYFTREEILSFGDLTTGRNIFAVNTSASQNALADQPRIAKATVRKQYPNKLQVQIQERVPVAILAYGGSYLEVDKAGYVLGVLADNQPLTLPLITGSSPSYVRTGMRLEQPQIRDGAAIAGTLTKDLSHQIAEINVTDPGNIVLVTVSRVQVLWGPASQLEEKAAVLHTLTKELTDKAGKLLDLRVPKSPVLR
jgi:cell division protein FtsQ